MKNFEDFGFVELNHNDLINSNGGLWWVPIVFLLGSMINDAQNNPDEFAAVGKRYGFEPK